MADETKSDPLNEFGTDQKNSNENIVPSKAQCESVAPCDPCESKERGYGSQLTQWAISGHDEYLAVGQTIPILPPGVYNQHRTQQGIRFEKMDIKVDALIDFPDGLPKLICDEIESFWTREKIFHDYGFLHRRGYLLYGIAGGGKTAVVQLVSNKIVMSGGIVMVCAHPSILKDALVTFRKIERDRRIICIFEDIDAIVSHHGDDELLALLDGEYQIDKVLNIATTNYPERLDRRLVARPRRFDRVIKVEPPSKETRRIYLSTKLKINGGELAEWVARSDGLSFAALAELVISVKCLGNDFESTLDMLKKMDSRKISSDEFSSRIGIHSNQHLLRKSILDKH